MPTKKPIHASAKDRPILAFAAEVKVIAATEVDGKPKGTPTFDVTAYNGGALQVGGWDLPVVIDLSGLEFARSVIANLDHDQKQRVGHVTAKEKTQSEIKLQGKFSAATAHRAVVLESAADEFPWEASIEVTPTKVVEVKDGKKVTVNGQEFSGPLYVTKTGILSGFGFVSHGADPNTTVAIAASKAASNKEHKMDEKLQAFIEAMLPGVDINELSPEAITNLTANYNGQNGKKPVKAKKADNPFEARKIEAKRREEIRDIADAVLERKGKGIARADIDAIEEMHDHAIESEMSPMEFKNELLEATIPMGVTVHAPKKDNQVSAEVIEAAICVHGRLSDVEKRYGDRVLQAAHDRFKHGIGLGEILMLGAVENGYHARPGERVTDGNLKQVLAAAFAPVRAAGFSTFTIPNSLSNVANKFVRDGWNFVDQAWREISTVRSVTDFKETTTVSLVDGLMFQPLAPNGEIKHGSVSETTYSNKADTYARMFVVDRRDIINDDLSVLTKVPQKLGRGGALKLNDIFWAEWVNPTTANFWHSSHVNVNEGVATMTIAGLTATELIFKALRGPDGNLLGSIPKILLVPPVHNAAALTLMSSERLIDGTATATQGDKNIFQGRFKVVESMYLADTSYTGFDVDAWWLLADPNDIPGIEVVALNGRVEPTLDTAEANFNVLGFQMRGYSDVGVRVQEPLCGVRSDNGSS